MHGYTRAPAEQGPKIGPYDKRPALHSEPARAAATAQPDAKVLTGTRES